MDLQMETKKKEQKKQFFNFFLFVSEIDYTYHHKVELEKKEVTIPWLEEIPWYHGHVDFHSV